MYACLHLPASAGGSSRCEDLLHLALEFSPVAEQTSDDTIVFSISALEKLFGTPHRLASEISRYGYERKLNANLAIAANPDTAILVARYCSGVTFVAPGREPDRLGSFVLSEFEHNAAVDPALLELLDRWGVKTFADLAALPEKGVAERLGAPGVYLRNLALGRIHRPLRIAAEETKYEEQVQLDYPVDNIEPLLFLFGRVLSGLCAKLRAQSQAARVLKLELSLESTKGADARRHTARKLIGPLGGAADTAPVLRESLQSQQKFACQLEFPVPLDDGRSMLKILQLHLERHPPPARVTGFVLQLAPADPRRVQSGLFLPPTPAPDKLEITISRIAGMVGEENVGSPELLDTHRPDAFRLRPLVADTFPARFQTDAGFSLKLALRIFRPALFARVRIAQARPREVIATGVGGKVIEAAGPWRTSGDWWTDSPWARDEWDVELSDGALYRIYCESKTKDWYVQAVYD
jgi:protein ImuB